MSRDHYDGPAAIDYMRGRLDDLQQEFGAPRDPGWAGEYLADSLPAGKFAIYGAGTQGAALLTALSRRSDVSIAGFLDRRADLLASFEGYPVLPPERVGELQADRIIVSHLRHERSMIDRLIELGVPADRIVPIYTDENFIRWAGDRFSEQLSGIPVGQIDHLLVTCAESTWSLLTNDELAAILPPSRTAYLYFGRAEGLEPDQGNRFAASIDLKQSLLGLQIVIEATKPVSIYVKSSVYHYGQFLSAYLKLRYPGLIVVVEMYDQALLLTDFKLSHGYDYDKSERDLLRAAERSTFDCCDLVVVKNGGAVWQDLCRNYLAPCVTYFPRITSEEIGRRSEARDGSLRIAFAGTLPRPEAYTEGADQLDMSYTTMIESMQPDHRFRIDLYNGAHRYPGHDVTFAPYRTQFPPGGVIQYFPAVSLSRLREILLGYDYGWHIMHERLDLVEPVSRVGIGNKYTTYLQAGLPIVIDTGFDFMAELVSSYDAGISIAPEDIAQLAEPLMLADLDRFRVGVAKLVAHMFQCNRTAIGRISSAMRIP